MTSSRGHLQPVEPNRLRHGRLVLLFDGFDELASAARRLAPHHPPGGPARSASLPQGRHLPPPLTPPASLLPLLPGGISPGQTATIGNVERRASRSFGFRVYSGRSLA